MFDSASANSVLLDFGHPAIAIFVIIFINFSAKLRGSYHVFKSIWERDFPLFANINFVEVTWLGFVRSISEFCKKNVFV